MTENSTAAAPTDVKSALFVERDGAQAQTISRELLREWVLSVWINGELSLKMVCTPSDLEELILGHLLSEGRITDRSQVESICLDHTGSRAEVTLRDHPQTKGEPLEIRACDCGANGILGRAEIDGWAVQQHSDGASWTSEEIFLLADAFREQTPIYRKTKGIHSCLLLYAGEIRYCSEDIGRHNALDKVIGHAIADGLDLHRCIVYSSGRIPEDMIAKVIRSGIPVLVSKATPTVRAVELARQYRVNLICSAHPDGFQVFSSPALWELPVTAGILAGGNSSRMGTDKLLLDNSGGTFLDYLQKQCAFLPETLVSLRSEDQLPGLEAACVLDEMEDFGPLEGIYQLLQFAQNEYVLVLAADLQGIDRPFLERFLRHLAPEDACMILKSANGLEPLCGVYSKSVLPVLEQMRQQNIRRPRLLFDQVRTHYVTASDLGMTEEALSDSVRNINTPEDYQRFLNRHQ